MPIFDDILATGVRKGELPARSTRARSWFRDAAASYGRVSPNKMQKDNKTRFTTKMEIGKMYMFAYEAKWADQLPYWDKFPLVFPIGPAPGGFYGINFHYLPLQLRARLMDSLYELSTDNRYDEKTRLRVNYGVLSSASRFKYFKPCVKRYLTNQLRSRFIEVSAAEWDIALFLDSSKFVKAGKQQVWAESQKKISKG